MCNMSHENHSGFYWQRAKGQTPTWDTGPESGHGGKGTYLYAEVSYPQVRKEYGIFLSLFYCYIVILWLNRDQPVVTGVGNWSTR